MRLMCWPFSLHGIRMVQSGLQLLESCSSLEGRETGRGRGALAGPKQQPEQRPAPADVAPPPPPEAMPPPPPPVPSGDSFAPPAPPLPSHAPPPPSGMPDWIAPVLRDLVVFVDPVVVPLARIFLQLAGCLSFCAAGCVTSLAAVVAAVPGVFKIRSIEDLTSLPRTCWRDR